MTKLLLSDILTSQVTTVLPETKIDQALALMRDQKISAIIITKDEYPVGIFTERDAVKVAGRGYDPAVSDIGEVMSQPVLSVPVDMAYREAYYLIAEHGVRHLVVTDAEGKLAGIVSEGDFMKNLGMEFLLHIKEVGALMTKEVQTLSPEIKVKEALSLMERRRLSCIVIVENDIPVGMLTERDIVRMTTEAGKMSEMPLSDVMTHPVTTVPPELPLPEAMQVMDKGNFRRVVVVDENGSTIGLLTRHDIVKQLYNRHVELLEESLRANETQLKTVSQELEKERGLHALESQLSESQRLAHIGSWELDLVTNELLWSEETYRIFEIDPKNFGASYEAFLNLVPPEEREMIHKAYNDSVENKIPYSIVHRLCFDDGRVKHVNERGIHYYDTEGNPIRSVGTIQDITDRHKQEEEIERYHSMLTALVESSTDSIFVKNSQGIYIVGNQALSDLIHRPVEEIIGADDYALFPLESAKHFREDDQRIIESNKVETYEESVVSGDKVIPFLTTKGPLMINGKIEGVFGISRDIGRLKETEYQLKENEDRLNQLLNTLPYGVQENNTEGVITYSNPAHHHMLGVNEGTLLGHHIWDFFPDEEQKQKLRDYLAYLVSEQPLPEPYLSKNITSDGREVILSIVWDYLRESSGEVRGFISVISDITDKMAAEEALRDRKKELNTIIEAIPNMLFVKDAKELKFVRFNAAGEKLVGHSREELIGKNDYDLFSKEDADFFTARDREVLTSGKELDIVEEQIDTPAGRRILHTKKVPIRDEKGEAKYLLGISEDITDRKRAEEELYQHAWFLESLDKVSKILTGEQDSLDLLQSLTELILEIFQVDRAWFLYPCNPEAPEYSVLSESTRDGFDGAYEKDLKMPMDDLVAGVFGHALEMDAPIINQVDEQEDVPDFVREFNIRSQMATVLRPELGDAWLMGLHQCSKKRVWTEIEMHLFQAISERISLALSGTIMLEQIKENEQLLLQAEQTAKLGHWELDIASGKAYWSDEIHHIMGTDPSQDVGPALLSTLVNKEDWPDVEASLMNAETKGTPHEMEYRINALNGEEHWLYCKAVRQNGKDENPGKLVGIAQDITERKKEEQSLRLSAAVFENTSEGVIITDADVHIISVNPAFTDVTGYSEEEVKGKNPRFLQSKKQDRTFYTQMWHALHTTGKWQGEIWNRKKNGEIYPEWLSLGMVKDEKGNIVNYIGLFSDITNVKKSEEELQFLATHDPLTKLPNRMLLHEQLDYTLKRRQRHNKPIAVLYIDLDRFKEVNDSLGHPAGDHLLKIMAERFRESLREEDFVARVSGDEFVVILEEVKSGNDAGKVAEAILNRIKQPMIIDAHEVTVTSSIGIAIGPTDGEDSVILLKNADNALYRAKEQGRNTYSFYSKELAEKNFELMYLHNALYNALEKEEFVVYYQPQVNMRTGEVIGSEALVRWESSEMGLVYPGRFIPVAEETGLIVPLGEWILRQACMQMVQWKSMGFSMQYVSVNLSGRQLEQENIVQTVHNVIADTGINPGYLELEITESMVMHDEENISKLVALKELGIRLSIDDFGTGYSSLTRLKRMPIDKLKIDQSFVFGIPDEEEDVKITEIIIQLSKSLNMSVIAEGVETETQKEHLMNKGCDLAQGFFYNHPQSPEVFEVWLRGQMASAVK